MLPLLKDTAVGAVECNTSDDDICSYKIAFILQTLHINLPCLWTIRRTIMTCPVAQSAALMH